MSASSDFYLGADGSYKPFATDKEKQANYSTMGDNGTLGGDGQSTSTGDSRANLVKKQGYEKGMVVCSQKKALLLLLLVFILILVIALIAALARPGCGSEVIEPTKPPVVTKPLIATNGERFPWDNYRLPKHAIPFHYQITIQPDYSTYKTFKGNVIVKFKVTEDTKFLVIHMGNLTVTQSSLSADVGINHPSIKKTLYLRERQQLYIHSEETMETNKTYLLRLQYTGKLEEGLDGIYVTHYTDPNGNKRYLVVTHFEPIQAREAFPCFDEPNWKTKFKIRIFRPKSFTALSNMPLEKTEDMSYFYENMDRDDFHETELMSTYLVAFVVSDYEYQEAAAGSVKLRVYTPPHQKSQAAFALDTCKKVIEYFTDFFGIPYPLPKLDLVAIPNFAAGAMENWGLITYKDRSILYDPSESDIASHERVAIVVAHELAHQWFGNLVTMEWWNDLWLNEGFASFMEMQGAGHSQPMWSLLEQFNIKKVTKALLLDALHSSHPISVSVEDPAEIGSLFDDISYKKGASIINMLMNFMGEDNMRKGLKDYLNKYRYKNAKTDDLWASLQNYSNADTSIKEVMDTWTKQMGYPLITIRRSGGSVTASQQRFVVTNASDSGPKSPYNYRWYVPLTCIVENVKNGPPTLHKKLIDVNRPNEKFLVNSLALWILCNVNQSGYYRVNYDLESWAALRKALNSEINTFTAKDRAGLLDDAFVFTRNGLLGVSVALDLTSYLPYEKKYTPWHVILTHLATWAEWSFEHAVYKKLNLFRRRLVKAQYDKLGWDDVGSHLDKLLRITVLATAIDAEMPHAIAQVKKRFDDWMRKNEKIPPNLKSIVYNGGVRYGGQEEWDFMKSKLSETDVASEKKLIMTALTSTRDPWILNQMLHDTLNASRVRSQDIVLIVSGVASNPVGKLMALRHVEMYWDAYYGVLKNANFLLSDLISKTTAHFSNIFDYKNIKGFFEGRSVGQGARALNQSLEFLYSHANWVNQNAATLEAWLDNYLANGYDIQA